MSRRIEARKRIRSHLRKKGDDYCEVTDTLILYWWHQLNYTIFDGILTPPRKIEIRNFHEGVYGWCKPFGRKNNGTVCIGIRREVDNRHTFLTTLVHEMVHQYQWEHERKMSHGKTFYRWADHLKRTVGLPLDEYVDP